MNMTQDVKKIYGNTLYEMMERDQNIAVVDADLMRIAGTESLLSAFPERYVNVGIAEQNALGVAAGMALMGKTVFVSAFCNFLATRASDQCLNTICYNELNVKLIGTYAGISSGVNGGTHISVTDIAAFRAMPCMRILEVSDGREMEWAIKEAAAIQGPVYIRVPKGPLHSIFAENVSFQIGKGNVISECIYESGSDAKRVALITSGITTVEGVKATSLLADKGISITHLHMTSIKPIDRDLLISMAQKHDIFVTADNHSVIGGLGSAVCEVVSEEAPIQVIRLGIQDEFCEGMYEKQLAERHGIAAYSMATKIEQLVK